MKKLVLSFAVLGLLSATACKKEETPKQEGEATEQSAANNEETPAAETPASNDVPKFEDADVQKYVETYDSFVKEYKEAVKSQDASKLQSLQTKANELQGQAIEVSKKLASNPDI